MKKYISLIFIGVLLLSSIAYAEEVKVENTSQINTTTNLQLNNRQPLGVIRQELEDKKVEIKDQIKQVIEVKKTELGIKREEIKNIIEAKKEEFKKEMDLLQANLKGKITANKEKLKNDLLKIKDEKKKQTVENITSKIAELNTRAVTRLNELTDKMEEGLLRVEVRANDAETRGIDVTTTRTLITSAKATIVEAKTSILAQSEKIYTANITTEVTLKGEMKIIKESLNTDIKTLRDKVKSVHIAVQLAATTLAQTPRVDEDKQVEE